MKMPKKFKLSKESKDKKEKPKKDFSKIAKRIKGIFLSLFIFSIATGFLLGVPKAVGFANQSLALINPQVPDQSSEVTGQVAGVEIAPVVQIESLGKPSPGFVASSVLAEDFGTGDILYQKNIHERLLPASTTKVMTAWVAVNHYKPTDTLTVTQNDLVGGSSMGLSSGETLSFRSALYGMLLNSGNDAAFTLASNYPGGVSAFVAAMNQRAQELGLVDTHFQNPAGFDDPGQYSSAYDLAKLASVAVTDPQIAKVVDTKQTTVSSANDSKEHNLKNVNELLGQNGVIGIKTGWTDGAGENLVGLVDRGGHKVLTVVLNSTNRFAETSKLMDWVYSNFTWTETSGR